MINLFGEEQEDYKKVLGHYKKWRQKNNYKKAFSFEKQCRTCKNERGFEYHNKHYHKCELQGISQSEASDIRLSYVCDFFNSKT